MWLRIFRNNPGNTKSGEAAATEDIPSGLAVWVEGIKSTVDIVAIHGLNGHREKTWIAWNKVNWLRDASMLPTIIPNARILSWGYDANTHSTEESSKIYLDKHAQNLVADLSLLRERDKTHTRPIIFVAHCLGGISLKNALIFSESIRTSTYGIIFMGTPYQGGEGIARGIETNSKLFDILKRNSEFLEQQLDDYNPISGNFETKFAFETKPTTLAFGKAEIVVPKSSAVVPGQRDAEQIAIMDDHINMVKFAKQSSDFTKVARHLKLMVEKASIKMQKN